MANNNLTNAKIAKNDEFYTQLVDIKKTARLIADDVENKKGIYSYILTKDERKLSVRDFSDAMKQKVYEK